MRLSKWHDNLIYQAALDWEMMLANEYEFNLLELVQDAIKDRVYSYPFLEESLIECIRQLQYNEEISDEEAEEFVGMLFEASV